MFFPVSAQYIKWSSDLSNLLLTTPIYTTDCNFHLSWPYTGQNLAGSAGPILISTSIMIILPDYRQVQSTFFTAGGAQQQRNCRGRGGQEEHGSSIVSWVTGGHLGSARLFLEPWGSCVPSGDPSGGDSD